MANIQLDIAQYKQWAGNNYQRIIAMGIALNSRAVYNFMKANRMLPQNWSPGLERTEQNRNIMARFLDEKAVASGNPLAWVRNMMQSVPMPTTTPDILHARKAMEQLIIKNR